MSRFFAVNPLTGQYEDIVCRKHPQGDRWYRVLIGTYDLGTVVRGARSFNGWDAITSGPAEILRGLRSASGFRTRWDAIEYMLTVTGIHGRDDFGSFGPADSEPVMSVVCADTIERGEVVTLCRVPGSDLYYGRKHDPYDTATRPAPDNVRTLGVEHFIAELVQRGKDRREREAEAQGTASPELVAAKSDPT